MQIKFEPEDEPQRKARIKRRLIILARHREVYFKVLLKDAIRPSVFVKAMEANRVKRERLLAEMKGE